MKKSITKKELIEAIKDVEDDVEIFIVNKKLDGTFDGVSGSFVLVSASDEKQYIALIAEGDILKI